MLIGLISDTHIPDRAREIPQKVFETFDNVDLILHAGDLTSPKVIEELEKIAPQIVKVKEKLFLGGNSMIDFKFDLQRFAHKSHAPRFGMI